MRGTEALLQRRATKRRQGRNEIWPAGALLAHLRVASRRVSHAPPALLESSRLADQARSHIPGTLIARPVLHPGLQPRRPRSHPSKGAQRRVSALLPPCGRHGNAMRLISRPKAPGCWRQRRRLPPAGPPCRRTHARFLNLRHLHARLGPAATRCRPPSPARRLPAAVTSQLLPAARPSAAPGWRSGGPACVKDARPA